MTTTITKIGLNFTTTAQPNFDLSGYYLSDDLYNPMKWTFPAGTKISGKGFLRIWCSGRDKYAASGIHTNFKLVQTKNLGEHIY
jgi:hypothetical protein